MKLKEDKELYGTKQNKNTCWEFQMNRKREKKKGM